METPEQTIARQTLEIQATEAKIALLEAKLDHLIRRVLWSKDEGIGSASSSFSSVMARGKNEMCQKKVSK